MWLERFGETNWTAYRCFMGISGLVAFLGLINMLSPCFNGGSSNGNNPGNNGRSKGRGINRRRTFRSRHYNLDLNNNSHSGIADTKKSSADKSPGHSLTFFIGFSSIFVAMAPLLYGIDSSWFQPHIYTVVCQMFSAPLILGFSMHTVCLVSKLMISITLYRKHKVSLKTLNAREGDAVVRPPQGIQYFEWPATLMVLLTMAIASALLVVWILLFPPMAQPVLIPGRNGSMVNGYACVDKRSSPIEGGHLTNSAAGDIDDVNANKEDDIHSIEKNSQLLWRISSTVFLLVILLAAGFQMPLLICIEMSSEYLVSTICYGFMTINTLISIAACSTAWITLRSRDLETDQLLYYIVSSLELWDALFGNVMALVATTVVIKADKDNPPRRTSIKRIVRSARWSIIPGLKTLETRNQNRIRRPNPPRMNRGRKPIAVVDEVEQPNHTEAVLEIAEL